VSHLGSRSPDMDLDTLSVRSDESGESTWDAEGKFWLILKVKF